VDPVDTKVRLRGREALLVDTAGIRKKARVERGVESASVMRALRVLERTDVAVLLVDATQGVAEQDARLLGLCVGRGRPVIVGLNKADTLSADARRKATRDARDALHFATWVPTVALSAKTGFGVSKLVDRVLRGYDAFQRRIPTAELNRFFRDVLERQPPPTSGGKAPRLYYVTQAESAPPVFVVMASAPDKVRESYRRFVANQIREAFAFEGVPIIVRFRKKSQRK
jgi:GTP-binding protein